MASSSSVELEEEINEDFRKRLKALYPMVNEDETPLPKTWSPDDKYSYIGLSHSNLRVHYKGHGKTHKDAASVRTCHSIPNTCGLFYFEVKIVCKGRDGYMGVGLSATNVNMNRLPGWDKHSYGYHGDDGHSFCSSGTGVPYGPTFTTGDVIGCGVNLIDKTCFYTKNGHHLGTAFTDLPDNLYPTVGLQTPGEIVDANFGQTCFVFDIEDERKELKARTKAKIVNFTIPGEIVDQELLVQRLVSSYLIHHGYCATAESLANSIGKQFTEEITSIKNRQKVFNLVLAGKIGETIEFTQQVYPGLLEGRPDLLFILKLQQFIEMVARCNNDDNSVTKSTQPLRDETGDANSETNDNSDDKVCTAVENSSESDDLSEHNKSKVAVKKMRRNSISNRSDIEKILSFGQKLYISIQQLCRVTRSEQEENKKRLQDAFGLLAYSNPWTSPLAQQLSPINRENICAQLNSAILEESNMAKRPELEVAVSHAKELFALMARSGISSCAFADVDDILLH